MRDSSSVVRLSYLVVRKLRFTRDGPFEIRFTLDEKLQDIIERRLLEEPGEQTSCQ